MEVRPRKIPRGGKLTSDQVSKLGRDIQITQRHLAVFSELLSELVPGQEHPEDLEMLVGVAATSQEMQDRVMELLGAVDSPEITAALLDINDKMNSEMERYKRYRAKCANRANSKKDPEVRKTRLKIINRQYHNTYPGFLPGRSSPSTARLCLLLAACWRCVPPSQSAQSGLCLSSQIWQRRGFSGIYLIFSKQETFIK